MTAAQKRNLTGYLLMAPYALAFGGFIILPIFVAAYLSVMQYDLTAPQATHFVGLGNFIDAFKDPYVAKAMGATLRYTLLMVPSILVISLAMGIGLNAMVRGRNVVRALLFLPGMLNVAVTGILWQWFYNNEFGFFNHVLKSIGITHSMLEHAGIPSGVPFLSQVSWAMPSIVLMSLWWTMGGTSVIVLTGLQQIPTPIFEAAVLDGCTGMPLFSKITLPLLKPVLLFVVVTNTIAAFQMFGQAFMLTNGGPELSTRGMVQYIYECAFNNYRLGYGAALSWLLFAVIGLFGLVQYKALRRGNA